MSEPESNASEEAKVGRFVCEWCETPYETTRARLADGGVITHLGWCFKCGCETWSKPVHLAASRSPAPAPSATEEGT